MSDRRSSVLIGITVGCVAGVVAFLALGQSGSTTLYTAPLTTSVEASIASSSALSPARQTILSSGYASDYEPAETTDDSAIVYAPDVQTSRWSGLVGGLLAVPAAVAGLLLFNQRSKSEEKQLLVSVDDMLSAGKQALVASAVVGATVAMPNAADAYPIFAQQGYENPREATGRIVCANCHLAAKKTEIELPQAVFPDQVFEAVSKVPYTGAPSPNVVDATSVVGSVTFVGTEPKEFIQESGIPVSQTLIEMAVPNTPNTVFKATIKVPYDDSVRQPSAVGKPVALNVGAVVVLPEGFRLAPPERIPEKLKAEMKGLEFIQYSDSAPNIIVAGPVPGKDYEEMHIALLSPDPETNRNVHYGTLPVYAGGNRGRGQLYPTGEKSNVNPYEVQHTGKIEQIILKSEKKQIYEIEIKEANGAIVKETLTPGATLTVEVGQMVEAGQLITTNPNVGGFGQAETEIVLQDPNRIKFFLFFSFSVLATQTMLVVKKKQYEQVQLAEMNF